MRFTFAAGVLAGACVSLLSIPLSHAEEAVVVEATRFPEEVRRLPASTTVLTADDIARSSARTLPEILSEQVGITIKDFYGNNAATTAVDLRGFGITGAQNTLVLLDGQRLNDNDLSGVQWAAIPLSQIERVEILRGSGSVLYGDGATGGVINIVTRSPLKQGRALEALGRIGSFDTREGQLYGSYGNDSFGANASVYGYDSDGYRANNRNEQQNNTLNLRWALGEGALDLRAGSDRQDVRLPGGRLIQPSIGLNQYADDRHGAQTPLDYASRDGTRIGVGFTQLLGKVEFSVGFDHRDKDQRSFFDQGGFPAYRADRLDYTSLTPRARIPFALGGMEHRVVVGGDWHWWRYRSRRTDRPENLSQPTNRVRVSQDTEGYYVEDTVKVATATALSAGWRTERVKYAGEDAVDPTAPACFFCSAAAPARQTQSQDAWELGVRQGLGERYAVYGRTGRSFRFVNAEEIYENDIFFAPQFQILQPQAAHTYEVGVQRLSNFSFRVALFRTDVSNEIHLDPFTTGVGNTNLPPSRREGVELDGKWQAAPSLQLAAGYAYTEARFREGTLAGSPFAIGTNLPIAGRTVPLVPRHKLNASAAWDMTGRTRLSAALTAVSSQVMDNDEPNTLGTRIPAYALVDAKLSHKLGWGRISAAVNNLFKQSYYTYAVRSAFVADRYAVYPLPGRTFSLAAEVFLP